MKTIVAENTEAEVKKWVKDVLHKYNVYYHMPVQTGIGAAGVDFHCVVKTVKGFPLGFFIEVKKFGKVPTDRQKLFIQERKEKQNARTFVIDGMVGVNKLEYWIEAITRSTSENK
jgi:hypothetical protein